MWVSGLLSEWFLLHGIPFLRSMPLVRDLPLIGGYFKISKIIIPMSDHAVITRITQPTNAFFIGPNHPEFTTDWLIDKYISTHYAPSISCWAAASIINGGLKPFWLANNLIGNNGGERAKRYSIESALSGKGTLLHPEGTVRWRGDKIFDLLPGIVDMSVDAAREVAAEGIDKPVFILPLLWKILYDGNIEKALNRDLERLEKDLELPRLDSLTTAARYLKLQQNLLSKQMIRFGFDCAAVGGPDVDSAHRFFDSLLSELSSKYDVQAGTDHIHRVLFKLYKAARERQERTDQAKVEELQRLVSYSPETFQKGFFYQEEIAEGIQFIKQIFFTKGYDSVKASLPKPFGWRTLIIRAAEPIDVTKAVRERGDSPDLNVALLKELKARMEETLAQLVAECASNVKLYC
jgi:hypothetical protein